MKKTWKNIGKPLIFTVVALAVILVFYFCSRKQVDNSEKLSAQDAVAEIVNRDLELNYPSTPKSVVTLYSDIISVIYKEKLTDEQLESLAKQARGLFDEELLQLNEYNEYMTRLRAEVKLYQTQERFISGYVVENGYNIEYYKLKGESYAEVAVKYYVREGSKVLDVYEEYTLREDDDGNWRILFWELADATSMEE